MTGFPKFDELRDLIRLAVEEDLGGPGLKGDDVTSRLMIPSDAHGVATLVQRGRGVACGLPMVPMVCNAYDQRLSVNPVRGKTLRELEGRYSGAKTTRLVQIRGPLRSILSAERVVLNFLQRMSGIATMTRLFVKEIAGTPAKVLDTRKTLPGHRLLDKYAVRCGGGQNHRIGLYDGLLIKDNHLAGLDLDEIAPFVAAVVNRSLSEDPCRLIEVEVDRLEQLVEVLKVDGVQVVLLDNMDCATMTKAVRLRTQALAQSTKRKPHERRDQNPSASVRKRTIQLEASGGVTLETVRAIAKTRVDRISVGALTHSVRALDIGLDIQPK